jgi:hypothetical protein
MHEPKDAKLIQAGVVAPDPLHRARTDVARGDRVEESRIETDADQISRVAHTLPVEHDLPVQMVPSADGKMADAPTGDVRETPVAPSVWEAVEEPDHG